MKDKNLIVPAPVSANGDDVTTWALPEGAIARLGRGSVRDMTFSPDGQCFAVASAIGLWLYELSTLSPITLCDTERGMTDSITFSPDNRWIVTHTCAGDIKIWDIERGVCITKVDDHGRSGISKPVFSQDGQRIAAISFSSHGKIYVWCLHTGEQLSETEIQYSYDIYPYRFTPDARLLVGKKSERDADPEAFIIWHVETGERIGCITEYPDEMENLRFSPNGRHLAASSSDGAIWVWNIEKGQLVTTYTDYSDAKIFPHYTSTDELIAAVVSDRKVEVWNIEQNEKLDEFEHRGNSGRYSCFSENGTQLAVASPSEIKIWTKGNNADTHTVSTIHGHIPTIDTLAISENEKTLAAGLWRDNVLLWNIASRCSYRPHDEKLPGTNHNVFLSPDRKIISMNVYGDNLYVSEVSKSQAIAKITGPEEGLGRAKAFAPTGHRIARADRNDNIHIWERIPILNNKTEAESWKKHITLLNDKDFFDGLRYNPNGLAFSPDGKRLASISRSRDCKACLWDADSGEQITELSLTSPTNYAKDAGIVFSPNGEIIAGGKLGEIRLWDATDGRMLMTLPQPEGNHRPITLCFSPCGHYLLSGSWWQPDLQKVPIRLWKVDTGENIATFWGHTTDVQCFAFSQDGTLLVSGGHDGAIYLWDLKPYL